MNFIKLTLILGLTWFSLGASAAPKAISCLVLNESRYINGSAQKIGSLLFDLDASRPRPVSLGTYCVYGVNSNNEGDILAANRDGTCGRSVSPQQVVSLSVNNLLAGGQLSFVAETKMRDSQGKDLSLNHWVRNLNLPFETTIEIDGRASVETPGAAPQKTIQIVIQCR